MHLIQDDPIRPDQIRPIWGKLDDSDRFLKSVSHKKNKKKKTFQEKLHTGIIILLNYYLQTCIINFNTSIVILDFKI